MSYFGTQKLARIPFGDTEIAKAYLGDTLVFQKGGTPPTPMIELPWDSAQLFSNIRWYSFLSGTLQTGDILDFGISDYTTYDISVYICRTKEYAGTMVLDTGWIAYDFHKVIEASENGCYVRVTIRRKNNGRMTVAEGNALVETQTAKRYQSS